MIGEDVRSFGPWHIVGVSGSYEQQSLIRNSPNISNGATAEQRISAYHAEATTFSRAHRYPFLDPASNDPLPPAINDGFWGGQMVFRDV